MLDLIVRNGLVVTPQGVAKWTIGISGEQIAYVGIDDRSMQAGRTIDADGKIVVPGGIEPHAHLDIFDLTNPDSGRFTLGPEDDTRGMAFGGTTTHLDFCFVEPSMDITKAIDERAARWKGNSFMLQYPWSWAPWAYELVVGSTFSARERVLLPRKSQSFEPKGLER